MYDGTPRSYERWEGNSHPLNYESFHSLGDVSLLCSIRALLILMNIKFEYVYNENKLHFADQYNCIIIRYTSAPNISQWVCVCTEQVGLVGFLRTVMQVT